MSADQARVCSLLLQDTFGDIVEKIGSHLISRGPLTLPQISKQLELPINEIRKSLQVLIQHQLVSYDNNSKQLVYRPELSTILGMGRYPRYIYWEQEMGREEGEGIIDDILSHGQTSIHTCVTRVARRLNEDNNGLKKRHQPEDKIRKTFKSLIEQQYIVKARCHSINPSPSLQPVMSDRKRGRSPGDEGAEPVAKRSNRMVSSSDNNQPDMLDHHILWVVNVAQFHKHYRHKNIIQAVGEKIDPTSSIIIKAMIKAGEGVSMTTGQDVPLYTHKGPDVFPSLIMESLSSNLTLEREELEQYLALLIEEQFVTKTDDAGGGSYCINYKKCSEMLCQATLESVVRERFGSKPLRLFKLLLKKKHLEQKQLTDMALIPNKESKEMLYSLLAENFVSLQEIPRANDYMPSRTFYLFSVNKTQVSRMVLQKCYKALGNLMTKRKHEMTENKRLLDKYMQWEKQQALLGGVAEGAESEVEELVTPKERDVAEKVKFNIEKLQRGELQLEDTIFVIEEYLGYLTSKPEQ